jgi:hypothetical protein
MWLVHAIVLQLAMLNAGSDKHPLAGIDWHSRAVAFNSLKHGFVSWCRIRKGMTWGECHEIIKAVPNVVWGSGKSSFTRYDSYGLTISDYDGKVVGVKFYPVPLLRRALAELFWPSTVANKLD